MPRLGRHLRALAVWAIVLFALWLLLVGAWDRSIALVGAACAIAAAVLAEVLRTRADVRAHVRPALLWQGAAAPLMIVADFAVLVWALARSGLERRVVRGALVERPLRERGQGAQAWISLAATYSPNAFVVEIDTERDTVLLHDLVPWGRSESPA